MTDRINAWVGSAVTELATTTWVQIDLDDVLQAEPERAVQSGLDCLRRAVDTARLADPRLGGLLTIPLPETTNMTTESPTLDELTSVRWRYGPGRSVPGLYLFRTSSWAEFENGEDYRRSLPPTQTLPHEWAAYYRTWRTQEHADLGWEYDRAVYVHTVDATRSR